MVKDMDQGEFGKKKKETEARTTRKRKQDKKEEPSVASVPFKKKSIFFRYLSYWKTLDTPHAIDCMHLEENVFESTISILLDFKKKTKDGLKSRTDLCQPRHQERPSPATIHAERESQSLGCGVQPDVRREEGCVPVASGCQGANGVTP